MFQSFLSIYFTPIKIHTCDMSNLFWFNQFDIEASADEIMSPKVRFKAKRLSFSCCLLAIATTSVGVTHNHTTPTKIVSQIQISVVKIIFERGLFSFSPFYTHSYLHLGLEITTPVFGCLTTFSIIFCGGG